MEIKRTVEIFTRSLIYGKRYYQGRIVKFGHDWFFGAYAIVMCNDNKLRDVYLERITILNSIINPITDTLS